MIGKENLQKAVQITVAAGYQLDTEAFALLNDIATEKDILAVMGDILRNIETLPEKPVFIGRPLLETLVRKWAIPEEHTPSEMRTPQLEEQPKEPPQRPEFQTSNGRGSTFCPYAKEIVSEITVIEDPTSKLTSNGTIEDFAQYFRDRFERTERLLRQRIDVKSATSIPEALKAQAKTKLKIICMISEKREVKHQTMLSVEDLQGNATILIAHNAPAELHKKAQLLINDQVVCIAVLKTRGPLFLAEDIIFPEVGQKPLRRASQPVFAVLTSDIHAGSNKFNKEAFKRFISWLNGKYGDEKMRELAGHVKYVLVAGDIVDGVGVYPNQAQELVIRDVHNQYKFAAKMIERIPDYIEVVITPGNHDAPRKALPMPAISSDYLDIITRSRRVHSLGDPSVVSIHNVEVLMYHGRSLDDVVSAVPGLSHSQPEKAMKLLLQGRHLAPLYGGKTLLSPENRDFLVIDRVPDIFHSGHVHVMGYCNYRGVLVVNSGGWQDQTEYMHKLGLVPTPGKVPVVNLQTLETTVLSFI